MKYLIAFILTSITMAQSVDYKDIVGSYQVTYDLYPIYNEITIRDNTSVLLKEVGAGWIMTCESLDSKLVDNRLSADMKCDKTAKRLSIIIDFSGVSNFDSFKARYSNSLYDLSDYMNFERF